MILLARMCRFATVAALAVMAAEGAAVSRVRYGTYLPYINNATSVDGVPTEYHVSTDRMGNTYIAGSNMRLLPGPDPSHPTDGFTFDSFVAKIAADGKSRPVTTTLKNSVATGLALDPAGNVYVVGSIYESGAFDVTPGAFQTDTGVGFVAKLAPDGSVIYSSRISAQPRAVAADSSGAAYVTGIAASDFRSTPGVLKPAIGEAKCSDKYGNTYFPCSDAFVAKVSSDGTKLAYATFLGGTGDDFGSAIAVDASGSAYVAGETLSSDFPLTTGAFETKYGGTVTLGPLNFGDGFAARLDAAGRSLVYATYLGGSGVDFATGIAVDASQNAYVAGTTRSRDFPATAGAFQPIYGGDTNPIPERRGDAFFVELGPTGQGAFASYLGGPGEERGGAVALGPGNRFYLTVDGPIVRFLDHRLPTPCDPRTALVAIDRGSGKVVDFTGVPEADGYNAAPEFGVDGSGVVHVVGSAALSGDPFAVTADALYTSGGAFLARMDFSLADQFAPACLANAASYALQRQFTGPGLSVAPGEIISLFGIGLGPAEAVAAQADTAGVLPKQLAGTSVRIGDTTLPLLYASEGQVNAIAPYSLNPGTKTTLTIANQGYEVSYAVAIAPQFPSIFTLDGSGRGQVAALNQDGTVNSATNPAPLGSVISLFTTGFGRLTGALPDDVLTPLMPPWPAPQQHFQLYMSAPVASGAEGMEVLYAGPAPGLPPGVYQVNARIPADGTGIVVFAFDPPDFDRTQDPTLQRVFVSVKAP